MKLFVIDKESVDYAALKNIEGLKVFKPHKQQKRHCGYCGDNNAGYCPYCG